MDYDFDVSLFKLAHEKGLHAARDPVVLALGMGTNSIAVICGMIERGMRPPDAIMFADTGGERRRTYAYIATLNAFLLRNGWPEVMIVKKGGRVETLEENCLRLSMLPSIAYGHKGCSQKFKIEPQERECNRLFRGHFRRGGKIVKLLGYDFHETRRWMRAGIEDKKCYYLFPLVLWEWGRKECVEAILRAGLPLPGKSSCFFCPSSTVPEVIELSKEDPIQFKRAIRIEFHSRDNLRTVKGLGRRMSWIETIADAAPNIEAACAALGMTEDEIATYRTRAAKVPAAEVENIAPCGHCTDFSSNDQKAT